MTLNALAWRLEATHRRVAALAAKKRAAEAAAGGGGGGGGAAGATPKKGAKKGGPGALVPAAAAPAGDVMVVEGEEEADVGALGSPGGATGGAGAGGEVVVSAFRYNHSGKSAGEFAACGVSLGCLLLDHCCAALLLWSLSPLSAPRFPIHVPSMALSPGPYADILFPMYQPCNHPPCSRPGR